MTLDLSALDANTGIPVPDPLWPTPDDIQQIQPPTLNFSQSGSAPGSTMQASIAMAQVVFQMPPEYPLQAKQRGIEGQVTLDLAINRRAEWKISSWWMKPPVACFIALLPEPCSGGALRRPSRPNGNG